MLTSLIGLLLLEAVVLLLLCSVNRLFSAQQTNLHQYCCSCCRYLQGKREKLSTGRRSYLCRRRRLNRALAHTQLHIHSSYFGSKYLPVSVGPLRGRSTVEAAIGAGQQPSERTNNGRAANFQCHSAAAVAKPRAIPK